VLLLHAREDAWFPPSHSEAILARIPHPRKSLVVTDWGAEHGRSITARPAEYARLVDGFLDRWAPR
jgi:pimeloyl-ACP methyl ester carboxylesterase